MLPSKRPYLADEELGKKDDDHRPRTAPEPFWRSRKLKAPRPRRFLLVIIILSLLYLFFKNMPTDLRPAVERYNPALSQKGGMPLSYQPPSLAIPPQEPPPSDGSGTANKEGDVKFPSLGRSLRLFWKPPSRYGRPVSRSVVFAGSSLRSVSDLLPLACRMADQQMNEVHFVLMGRDDVSIEGIQRVNGVNDIDCPINWHDSRPDSAQWSTDVRIERAVALGIGLVNEVTHPQAIITQGESWEDLLFWRGIRKTTREVGVTHIALPRPTRDLMWISALDSSALRVWNDVHVEILIQAPSEASGSLIRLIRSLKAADYLGSMPSLTIELPPRVDPQLLNFLKTIDWPPETSSTVTLRRRIQPHDMNAAEASLRTAEAFYPRDPNLTHVLMLSPQAELAPSFYHYLKYSMLKYKYSANAKQLSSRLLGISLELPSSQLTDSQPFNPPDIDSRSQFLRENDGEVLPVFLWQAPNSNAALYFGDKWVEFHDFLTGRFTIQESKSEAPSDEKVVLKKYPAVMEYLLELIRARGYYLLYPAFPSRGDFTLATIHTELYQPPEEFAQDSSLEPSEISVDDLEFGEKPLDRASTIMHLFNRFSLSLSELDNLPLLSYRGEVISDVVYAQDTDEYMNKFRVRYGGCSDHDEKDETSLFCFDNEMDS